MSFYKLDESSKKSRAEQLVDKDADGSKQGEKVSEHAPSRVDDAELVARSLEYPSKFHVPDGGLNDSFFQDAYTHGASAQRLLNGWEASGADVHIRFEARAKARREGLDGRAAKQDFVYVGMFHMTAGELRDVRLSGETTARVRVYDAGNDESDPLHAEIIADVSGLKKQQKHELRVHLMSLAEKRGLHASPFLDSDGQRKAVSTQCQLIPLSDAMLLKCKQGVAQDAGNAAIASLPPAGEAAA